MSDQKNIDNLFRETFKDFEASPDPALWDKISDRLDAKEAKKKRRGIIFLPWLYKGAGIAAALLLLFFVGNEFLNTNDIDKGSNEQITTTSKKDANLNENNTNTTGDTEVINTNTEQNSSNDANSSANKIINDQERIATENGVDNPNIQQKKGSDTTVQKGNALQNTVAQQNGTNSTTTSQKSSNGTKLNSVTNNKLIDKENAVTQNLNNKTNSSKKGVENDTNSSTTNTNAVAQNSNTGTKTSVNGVNSSKTDTNKVINSNTSTIAQNNLKNSINVLDSTATETMETVVAEVKKEDSIKKSLLDVINDLHDLEKDAEVAEAKRKKWTISPNASPIYYNSISGGSPIDETFADNSKTGNINLSYGVNVGYDVSKRLTVRSGIHKVDYSYNTQDIALVPSINGNDLTTIAFKTDASSFDIKDKQVSSNTMVYSQYQLPTSESSIFEKQIEGNLNQRMSYIEVPVELKYAVLDKKFGINVIGGVSTLLLTENSILLDSPELYTELGEATNVNTVSFSTNIGVGIDYKISDQLEFNVEPMLKYQLNTFSGNTGNFKPYSVGVYTGVSFRF